MLKALNLLVQSRSENVDSEKPEIEMVGTPEVCEASKTVEEKCTPCESIKQIINVAARPNDPVEEIYTWIDQITFSRPRKNFARDFSDGVLMAELLKRYYPRYVDLHNYMSRNSVAYKVDNWSTLNRKVLSKIGMKLSKDQIVKLAYSEPGAIEAVLTDLRKKILKDSNADRDNLYFDYEDNGKGETIKCVLNPEEVANKTVPRQAFVKLKQELQEKKSVINTLSEKVSHLESLMKLKDQRIADLTAQITGSAEKIITPRPSLSGNGSARSRMN